MKYVKVDGNNVAVPQVNLNGSGRRQLEKQYLLVYNSMKEATRVLTANGPHGRDYQTMEAAAFLVAQRQHADRVKQLESACLEIEAIIVSLAEI